jgi:hypothetical protein
MIEWFPIKEIPEGMKDGTCLLLWFKSPNTTKEIGDIVVEGWWFSSPKGLDDGWETPLGFIGEPSYFAYLNSPRFE